MPLVVADAGPLHYLVLTGDIELLPKLFERVLVPQVVRDELANAEAPQAVRDWIARAPGWLDVRPAHPGADDVAVAKLDEGERAATAPPGGGHWCGCCRTPVAPCSGTISPSATPVGPGPSGSLPLADQAVDRVLMSLVIHQIAHREQALQEVYRVLRPGGRVLVRTVAPEVALQA